MRRSGSGLTDVLDALSQGASRAARGDHLRASPFSSAEQIEELGRRFEAAGGAAGVPGQVRLTTEAGLRKFIVGVSTVGGPDVVE